MSPLFYLLPLCVLAACSPLRTSPHDEKYQWELTLHEVQTNVDDLRHDTHCFETEMQILEARVRGFETALASLKQQEIEKSQAKMDQLSYQVQTIEKKLSSFEKKQDLELLSTHAKETNVALTQFKSRLEELESEVLSQNRRLDALARLKGNLEQLTKTLGPKMYKVRPGDSLEKIAKAHKTDVATLKQLNQLQQDRIVVDQELKMP